MSRWRKTIVLAMVATTLVPAMASAASISDSRGYNSCEEELNASLKNAGLMVENRFEVARKGTKKVFFLSGSAWAEDGSRTTLKTRCETDRFGRLVLSIRTESDKPVSGARSVAVR